MTEPGRISSDLDSKRYTGTKRERIGGILVVAFVGALGLTLALQGWRSHSVDPSDWVFDVATARDFLATGQIPEHGTFTSYRSYAPPGAAWLYLPGVLLFTDPRLILVSAGVVLYLATLAGIFLLARLHFGLQVGILSVIFYALCAPALELASFGNPRGFPPFFIAMVYCISLWVFRCDSRFLAAAIGIWSLGMLVYMELAPAAFSIVAVWFFWRPPVRLLSISFAVVFALVIWFPYLRFEAKRSFVDVRSQVTRTHLPALLNAETWCDQKLAAAYSDTVNQTMDPAPASDAWIRASSIGHFLRDIFRSSIAGTDLVLPLLMLGGLLLSLCTLPPSSGLPFDWGFGHELLAVLFAGLLGLGAVTRLIESHLVTRFLSPGTLLFVFTVYLIAHVGIIILRQRPFGTMFRALAAAFHPSCNPQPLAITLLVPWMVLLLIAEPDHVGRFWWLAPLQMIVLAVFIRAVLATLQIPLLGRCAAYTVVLSLLVFNPLLLHKIEAWRQDGWSGTDGAELQAARYVASLIHLSGKDAARIGYQHPARISAAALRDVDVRMTPDKNIDVFLNQYGVANVNHCWGLSSDDEYRIVDNLSGPGKYDFYVPSLGRLQLLERFGTLEVYKRF